MDAELGVDAETSLDVEPGVDGVNVADTELSDLSRMVQETAAGVGFGWNWVGAV